MVGTRYHFVTTMRFAADGDRLWDVLDDPEAWPTWWRWLRSVAVLEEGDATGIGKTVRNEVATPLGYRLTYYGTTRHRRERNLLEFDATGDLVGQGQFRSGSNSEHTTEIVFNWLVETPKWWMNLAARLARPVFAWNHNRLMSDFALGLAGAAGGSLIEVSNEAIRPDRPEFYQLPGT
jgi:uncharacterized membrane protein